MGLEKAIKYKKEKRKPYRGAKAVDDHCRNHGGRRHSWECEYCKGNRLHNNKKKEEKAKYEE